MQGVEPICRRNVPDRPQAGGGTCHTEGDREVEWVKPRGRLAPDRYPGPHPVYILHPVCEWRCAPGKDVAGTQGKLGQAIHIPLTVSYSTKALLRDIHEAFL